MYHDRIEDLEFDR